LPVVVDDEGGDEKDCCWSNSGSSIRGDIAVYCTSIDLTTGARGLFV